MVSCRFYHAFVIAFMFLRLGVSVGFWAYVCIPLRVFLRFCLLVSMVYVRVCVLWFSVRSCWFLRVVLCVYVRFLLVSVYLVYGSLRFFWFMRFCCAFLLVFARLCAFIGVCLRPLLCFCVSVSLSFSARLCVIVVAFLCVSAFVYAYVRGCAASARFCGCLRVYMRLFGCYVGVCLMLRGCDCVYVGFCACACLCYCFSVSGGACAWTCVSLRFCALF